MDLLELDFGKPIIKTGVRILRPIEYEALRAQALLLRKDNATNLDALLETGMRYVEAQRLQKNPDWFDGRQTIFLPKEAILKHLRKQKERFIKLTPRGVECLLQFFQSRKLPSTQMWGVDLRRWAKRGGLDPISIGPKTTRKTLESWLVYSYPERRDDIFARQGHTGTTSFHHYLGMPFDDQDKEGMKPWVGGLY